MDNLEQHLKEVAKSDSLDEQSRTLLQDCRDLLRSHDTLPSEQGLPQLLEALLTTILKPLFSHSTVRSYNRAKWVSDTPKPWRDSAAWCLEVLSWSLDQYQTLEPCLLSRVLESHLLLLIPPILTLLDDDHVEQKARGCRMLDKLCTQFSRCQSDLLRRTGLYKVFEESITPNMLLLPSLTPEDQSLEMLRSLYPAYRSLVSATFDLANTKMTYTGNIRDGISPTRQPNLEDCYKPDPHGGRKPMLDKMFRNGLMTGYLHASDHPQIAALLVSEMAPTIETMGISSVKYLSQLLPLLRNIVMGPFAAAYEPLLEAVINLLQQLILQCWPRIQEAWWEECLRIVVGLWLLISDQDVMEAGRLKTDTRALVRLLVKLHEPNQVRRCFDLMLVEYPPLAELLPPI